MNELQTPNARANAGVANTEDLIMESLTIKQLEAMCAAFELAFGEDEDFMVWLAEVWQPTLNAERRTPTSGRRGGLQ